jgi:hypothetical protein
MFELDSNGVARDFHRIIQRPRILNLPPMPVIPNAHGGQPLARLLLFVEDADSGFELRARNADLLVFRFHLKIGQFTSTRLTASPFLPVCCSFGKDLYVIAIQASVHE